MDNWKKKPGILLAGPTGYLGRHIVQELVQQRIPARLLARPQSSGLLSESGLTEIYKAQVTHPHTLKGCMSGIHTIISTIGITRQKDGLTYMDVDYQANSNLLREARKAGARKFIYISAVNGEINRHLKIFEAKERFVDELKQSGLEYCIIRPSGFFSDFGDLLAMASRGKIYMFDHGNYRLNPIHGADLAKICVGVISSQENEIIVGGPDVLTQNEICEIALQAWSKPVRIIHLPDWIRKSTLNIARLFTSSATYGPMEFFLSYMVGDHVAPPYGNHHVKDFFFDLAEQSRIWEKQVIVG